MPSEVGLATLTVGAATVALVLEEVIVELLEALDVNPGAIVTLFLLVDTLPVIALLVILVECPPLGLFVRSIADTIRRVKAVDCLDMVIV